MPTRTIQLNVLGDASGATKALSQVDQKASQTAAHSTGAFKGMLGILGSSGAFAPFMGALDQISGAIDHIKEHSKSIGGALVGAGVGVAGIGGLLTAAAGPDSVAKAQLQAAIEATGKSYDDFKPHIDAVIKQQEKYGSTANETQDALRNLTQGLQDPQKALDNMGLAANLAAARHESLSAAADQLVKIYAGKGARTLAEFGITVAKAGNATTQLAAAEKAAASADAADATAKQKLADVHALLAGKSKLTTAETIHLRDAQSAVTTADAKAFYAHVALTKAQDNAKASAAGHSQAVDELALRLQGQAAAAADTFSGRLKAIKAEVEDGAAKLGQKYGPALMGVGAASSMLGGLLGGAGKAMKLFSTGTEAAKTATEGMTVAEDAAAVSEGLALGPILLIIAGLAALGVGIYELVTHWKQVWGEIQKIAKGFVDWLGEHWPLILAILTGPIGLAVLFITQHWDGIVTFFSAIPGRLESVAGHMWDFISTAFKGAIDAVITMWNDFVGFLKIPGFHVGIGPLKVSFPGLDIGSSLKIPLLGEGGIALSPTLAMIGEKGPEAVVPLSRGGGPGWFGGGLTVPVTVAVDGRAIAVATAKFTRDELIRLGRSVPAVGLS